MRGQGFSQDLQVNTSTGASSLFGKGRASSTRQSRRSCRVLTSMSYATRSAWSTCSANLASSRRVERQANCTDRVQFIAPRPRTVAASRSTWKLDDTIATNATAMEINWSYGQPFINCQCTRPHSICAALSVEMSLGSNVGDPSEEQKRRGTGT